MATFIKEEQWSKCLTSCELCNLTPQVFDEYLADANSRTLECARDWESPLSAWDDKKTMAIIEGYEKDMQTRSIPEMVEACMSDSFPIPPTVETAGMTESDASSVDDDQDDVWSVVSDVCDSPSLQNDDQEELDEKSMADDDIKSDADEGKTNGEDKLVVSGNRKQRLGNKTDTEKSLGNDTNEEGNSLDKDTDEQAKYLDRDDEEDDQFDDCTEEGIRLAKVQKQLEDYKQETMRYCYRLEMMHRDQLNDTKRQHQSESITERERTANANAAAAVNQHECNRMSSRIGELEEKLKICKQETRNLEYELESKRCKELDSLQGEHHRQLDHYKLKFKQDRHLLRKALTESEDNRRRDAIKHANLFAEAADALSGQIKKAEDMKVACEKTLETTNRVHDIEVTKLHVNLRWLEDKIRRALAKEAEDHDAHLNTRNQLAKAIYEVEGLKQKEQEIARAKEELQRQHEQQLAEVRDWYEQQLRLAKQEHEADNALSEEQICDLESEMDEMCREKDERYHEKEQLCENMEEAYQDLEMTYDHDLSEAKDVIERLEQSLGTMSDELREVKEEKTQLKKDLDEAEATMEELCQQAQDNEAGREQDSCEAASQCQELEMKVGELRGALEGTNQEAKELRDQLRDAIKGMQESQERQQELKQREQALMSQCAADRVMFERSAYALRSLLQRN